MTLGSIYIRIHCASCKRTLTRCLMGSKIVNGHPIEFRRSPEDESYILEIKDHTVILCTSCGNRFLSKADATIYGAYVSLLKEYLGLDLQKRRDVGEASNGTFSQKRDALPTSSGVNTKRNRI